VFGTLIVLLLILLSWSTIIVLTVMQETLEAYATQALGTQFGSFLGPFVVPVGLAMLNAVIPILLGFVIAMEKWDEPAFAIKLMSGRLYVLKILNTWIIMISYLRLLWSEFASVLPWVLVQPVTGMCAEDQAGQALVAFVLTDFILDKVGSIASLVGKNLVARLRYAGTKHGDESDAFTVDKRPTSSFRSKTAL
jgi:hypothetical protein